jgi:hypothetical protein
MVGRIKKGCIYSWGVQLPLPDATATDPFVTPGIEALLLQKAHEKLADEASAQQVHQGDNSASTATHTEEGLLRKPTKISVFVRE